MAELSAYKDLKEKKDFFGNGQKNEESFVIKNKKQLDEWLKEIKKEEKNKVNTYPTSIIYRGLTEAKYKLYNSAQRLWITNDMQHWEKNEYMEFINYLVQTAKKNLLIKTIFDSYGYSSDIREFPILSLLQHYGFPTPLMDWTYNINVAFYFATVGLKGKKEPKEEIDNYFSIYRINKYEYRRQLTNVIDLWFIQKRSSKHKRILAFRVPEDAKGKPRLDTRPLHIISDFEVKGASTGFAASYEGLNIKNKKPWTLIFNQNIIPQQGLFIFNPFSLTTLENIFNHRSWKSENFPPKSGRFDCFNIHKDLAKYLKRKINVQFNINKGFIFPNFYNEETRIKEIALSGLI